MWSDKRTCSVNESAACCSFGCSGGAVFSSTDPKRSLGQNSDDSTYDCVSRVQQLAHAQRSTLHDMGTAAPPAVAICDTCKCRRRLSCEEVTRDKQQGAAHVRQPACL